MRFEVLVAAVAAGGLIVGVAGARLAFPANTTSAAFAEAAQTKVPTKITFGIQDINPLRWIYDAVMNDVATGANRSTIPFGSPVKVPDWSALRGMNAQFNSEFDPAKLQRWNAETLQMQMRENNLKFQEMAHGTPPY